MSIDQRGFKTLIQLEAEEFLHASQQMFNATVRDISYSKDGVTVTLTTGEKLAADYALCTFSLGVLQHNDVTFTPTLPGKFFSLWLCAHLSWSPTDFKQEAIQSMVMATYTKIFLHFSHKFWFDTEVRHIISFDDQD